MAMRFLGLAAIMFFCSIGVSAAQARPVGPEALAAAGTRAEAARKLMPKIMQGLKPHAQVSVGGATIEAQGDIPTGFNFVHATNCAWFNDGTNNIIFLFPEEGGFFASANNVFVSQIFNTGCQDDHILAINVTNGLTGAFNEVLTFAF